MLSNYLQLAQSAGRIRVQGAIAFDFASNWLKNWREIAIARRSKISGLFAIEGP